MFPCKHLLSNEKKTDLIIIHFFTFHGALAIGMPSKNWKGENYLWGCKQWFTKQKGYKRNEVMIYADWIRDFLGV